MDISVITPYYKGARYLDNFVKMLNMNVLQCPGVEIELVLVNDSPQEKIEESILNQLQIPFKILVNDTNLGIQGSRVRGIRASTGQYILMLDQDDEIAPEALKLQFEIIRSNPNANCVVANGWNEIEGGGRVPLFRNERIHQYINRINYFFYFGNIIASPGLCLIKRKALPKIWMEQMLKMSGADDWLLWAAYLANHNTFVVNPKYLYTHKKSEYNFSNDGDKMLISSKEALNVFSNYYSDKRSLKLIRVYGRRLTMRRHYFEHGKLIKLLEYLKNLDIAWFVYRMN